MAKPNLNIKAFGASMPSFAKKSEVIRRKKSSNVGRRDNKVGPNLNIKAFGASSPTSAKRSSYGFGGKRSVVPSNGSVFASAALSGLAGAFSPSSSTANATTTISSGGVGEVPGFDYSSLLNQALALSQSNSAFNAAEAQKNRDWQERMSNTAHQREVADLTAAGLNPILSVTGGSGAPVGSGATAYADSSGVSALSGVISSILASNATLSAAALASSASRYASELSNPLAYIFRGASTSGKKYADKIVRLIDKVFDKFL